MTSNRPYLLRALFEWIVDNGLTPHILVNAAYPDVQVPASAVRQDKVVLNIGPTAVRDLAMENEQIEFTARFGGQPHSVFVPVAAVQAIYARENGQGMMFAPETPDDDGGGNGHDDKSDGADERRQHLRVIK
ncbi:MAG: ClpXP protease specificity-enhancing factor [Wenzhouxiangellaceae bacterium]